MRHYRFAALGVVLLTVVIRLPALVHPRPIDDEGIYSVVANEIVDGGRPYTDAIERKPPLLFWTYAAVFKATGKYNWAALHLCCLAWTLLTMAGLYLLVSQLFDPPTGLIAALLYSIYQPWAEWRNLAFNGELLMNLPIVWTWTIAFAPTRSRLRPMLLAAGALSCAAFLLKQPAAIAAGPLCAYLILPAYRRSRGLTISQSYLHLGFFFVGFLSALAVTTVVLWKQGILQEAFYWTISNHDLPHFFLTHGIIMTVGFVGACLPLVLGAIFSIGQSTLWEGRRAERIALIAFLGASALGVAASGRFYVHYYIQLIPPLAVLAAAFYGSLWNDRAASPKSLLATRVIGLWLALTVVGFAISHWYGLAPRRAPTEAGRYLLQHAAPDERIFIWGQDPRMYLDAHRRPASRYVSTFPLTGFIFGEPLPDIDTRDRIVPGAWKNLEEDFKRHAPAYVVDLYHDSDAQYPVERFPFLAQFLARDFEPFLKTREGLIYRRRIPERSPPPP
jgi:4-amino-4-deoxy-L-arabinose transferase-like glycosyltransferase